MLDGKTRFNARAKYVGESLSLDHPGKPGADRVGGIVELSCCGGGAASYLNDLRVTVKSFL